MSSPADNHRYGKGESETAHKVLHFKLHSFPDEDMDKYNPHKIEISE